MKTILRDLFLATRFMRVCILIAAAEGLLLRITKKEVNHYD